MTPVSCKCSTFRTFRWKQPPFQGLSWKILWRTNENVPEAVLKEWLAEEQAYRMGGLG